eukprot:10327590-Alexandrium_andersonii.AAC.1
MRGLARSGKGSRSWERGLKGPTVLGKLSSAEASVCVLMSLRRFARSSRSRSAFIAALRFLRSRTS